MKQDIAQTFERPHALRPLRAGRSCKKELSRSLNGDNSDQKNNINDVDRRTRFQAPAHQRHIHELDAKALFARSVQGPQSREQILATQTIVRLAAGEGVETLSSSSEPDALPITPSHKRTDTRGRNGETESGREGETANRCCCIAVSLYRRLAVSLSLRLSASRYL
jgi:hypothetical protein